MSTRQFSRAEVGELYSPGAPAAFFRTYNRCNAIGALPDVGIPPPWHDPLALGEWYRVHYRSDTTKPASSAPKITLPNWLRDAIARGKTLSAPIPPPSPAPPAAAPLPGPPSQPVLALESPAPAPPDPEAADLPDLPPLPPPGREMSNIEAIAYARSILERARVRHVKVQNDEASAPAAARAYFEALERVQQAEKRARDAGDTDREMRRIVESAIDAIHHRLPRHLAQELATLRIEILRAAADPETFPGWCAEFFDAVGERLARSRILASAA